MSGLVYPPRTFARRRAYKGTRDTSKKVHSALTKGKKAHRLVVSKSEIRAYVESLDIRDLSTVAVRFQVVADLTSNAFEQCKEQLAPSELRLMKRIAEEYDSERYRRIMTAIISSVEKGRHDINLPHLTAVFAVRMAFKWSSEYHSALNTYRENLRRRQLSLLDRPSSRSTRRRSVLHVAGDR